MVRRAYIRIVAPRHLLYLRPDRQGRSRREIIRHRKLSCVIGKQQTPNPIRFLVGMRRLAARFQLARDVRKIPRFLKALLRVRILPLRRQPGVIILSDNGNKSPRRRFRRDGPLIIRPLARCNHILMHYRLIVINVYAVVRYEYGRSSACRCIG